MGTRDSVFGFIREAFAFGKVLASTMSPTNNTLWVRVEGDEGDAEGHPVKDDVWGHAPLLYQPVKPDSAGGHCEAFFYRLGDERVVLATKDRRFQIAVAEGEVIITAMGTGSPAYVHLKPDGSATVKATSINLGGDATQFVALANLVNDRVTSLQSKLDALIAKYNTHTHTGVTSGSGSSGATLLLETVVGTLASVAADKVKAK